MPYKFSYVLGWLAGRFIATWQTSYVSAGQINQSINQLTKQSVSHWINQSINQSISQSVNQLINQLINQSINKSINQSINQPISQSVTELISQSINQSINQCQAYTEPGRSDNAKTNKIQWNFKNKTGAKTNSQGISQFYLLPVFRWIKDLY